MIIITRLGCVYPVNILFGGENVILRCRLFKNVIYVFRNVINYLELQNMSSIYVIYVSFYIDDI